MVTPTKIKALPAATMKFKAMVGLPGTVSAGDGIVLVTSGRDSTISVDQSFPFQWTASHTWTLSNTTNKAITITQTGPTTGSMQGSLDYNKITVTSGMRVLAGSPSTEAPWADQTANGLKVRFNVGANATGFQIAEMVELWHTTATNIWADGSCDFIAHCVHAYTNAIDSGALGNGAGFFASCPGIQAGASAKHGDFVALNPTVDIFTGATIRNAIGARFQRGVGAGSAPGGRGSNIDAPITIVGSVAKWTDAFVLGDDISGSVVLSDNIMRAYTAFGCINFFDLHNVTASGSFLKFDTKVDWAGTGQLGITINSSAGNVNGVLLTNSHTGGIASFTAQNDLGGSGVADFGVRGTARASYGALVARDGYMYVNGTTGITIMADNATGVIKFAAGGNAQVAQIGTGTTALVVGRQGTTNPALQVDTSTASSATGLKVKAAAAAGGLALSVITSGTNENLTIDAAGSGTITLGGTSTGTINAARQFNVTINSTADSGSIITNSNSGGVCSITFHNDGAPIGDFGIRGSARATYGALVANDVYLYGNSTTGITIMADNATGKIKFAAGGNTQLAQIGPNGGFSVGSTTDVAGVINANVGFRVAAAATSGNVLRGDGTNFVSSALAATDLTGILPIAKGGTGAANGAIMLLGYAKGVNANSVADTAITITIPTGTTTYRLQSILFNNVGTTASLTVARAGCFSAAGGGGTALANDQALSGATANTVNTAGAAAALTSNTTAYYNFTTVQFRVGTAQGAAATIDVYVYGFAFP